MPKKKTVTPSPIVQSSQEIDLLLPILAKLGITVDRANRDTLAGFIKGLLHDDVLLWSEIWGGENEIHVQISSGFPFFEDRLAEMRVATERLSNLPACFEGDARWLRIAVSQPRPSGGRNVILIARIRSLDGNLTPELCEQKITVIVEFMRGDWPLK